MANIRYTIATELLLKADLDFENDDIRIMLVDSTTTADTEEDTTTIAGFSTLGELSGTGYVRKALASKTVTKDNANNQSYFDAADVTWTGINAGTAAAVLVYKHVTDDSDSVPIAYIDGGDFPIVTNGGDITLRWASDGIVKIGA